MALAWIPLITFLLISWVRAESASLFHQEITWSHGGSWHWWRHFNPYHCESKWNRFGEYQAGIRAALRKNSTKCKWGMYESWTLPVVWVTDRLRFSIENRLLVWIKPFLCAMYQFAVICVWSRYWGRYDVRDSSTGMSCDRLRFSIENRLLVWIKRVFCAMYQFAVICVWSRHWGRYDVRIRWTLPLVWVIYRIRFSIKNRWLWKPFFCAISQFAIDNFWSDRNTKIVVRLKGLRVSCVWS